MKRLLQNKRLTLHIVFALLTLFCMLFIFYMSSREADDSAEISGGVDFVLCRLFYRDFDSLNSAQKTELVLSIDHAVRKTAHAIEYMGLCLLLNFTFYTADEKYSKRVFLSWLCAAIYAGTDEFHQLFVPGRAGRITDVLIDSLGAFAGCILFLFIVYFVNKFHKISDN